MSWQPTFINGGLFDNTPSGNMTVPYDYSRQIGSVYESGDALYGWYGCSQKFDDTFLSWSAARGKSFSSKLISILDHHHGDPMTNDVVLYSCKVKNPEGAPYFKQELVVYGSYISDNIVQVTDPSNPYNKLDYFYAEVAITRISRRVYDTPTAVPTVTDLNVGTVSANMFIPIQGDLALESLYYFLDSGIFCAGPVHYGTKYYFGFGFYTINTRIYQRPEKDQRVNFSGVALPTDYLEEQFGGTFEPEETDDPNEDPDEPGGGESGEGGGESDHDDTEDNIPDPGLPPIGAADAGFVHMFKLTLTEIVAFARAMFDPTMWQAIKDFFADPMDFISGVMLVPFTPEGDAVRYPKFGSNVWPQAFTLVGNQFYRLDCGTLLCKQYYDSFLDYDSYTKVKIFLPYIGYKDLIADEVMGNNLHVYYNIDVATGDCVAFVEVQDGVNIQVTYQFQGNCGTRVPYGRQSFDAAVSASLNMLGGAAGTALALGGAAAVGGALAPAAAGIAAAQIAGQIGSMTASAVAGQKRTMERAGSIGGSAGYMGVQYPYLIRQIPNQSRPGNYRELHGYPSNIGGRLETFSGYTTLESILLEGFVATDAEKSEIIEMCKGGIII